MKSKRDKISEQEAKEYEELGEQWASRDLADYWEQTQPVECEIDIKSVVNYYPVESQLSAELDLAAKEYGTTPQALLNKWLQEKLHDKGINK
jgi:hypothetical protein